jgi:anhydro-N-acetylmuramic acid kinase
VACCIGLMSGTSLDGVDAVLADFETTGPPRALAHRHLPMPQGLRAELFALNGSGPDEIHRAALATNALMHLYAAAVRGVLHQSGIEMDRVAAVGAHGQTTQLVNGALLAELTGIDVVCDFRSRDVAAGGQGAPLVPAFHAAVFGRAGQDVAVLNLGGIANLTLLGADGRVGGFDCGPGNVLLDLWIQRHRGLPYDDGGAWAAGGTVLPPLLAAMLGEPYFGRAPPKSTGRDLFNDTWLRAHLQAAAPVASTRDVMATLAEFSAAVVADALRAQAPDTLELLVCGGGAHNADLLCRLATRLPPGTALRGTAVAGVPPDQVEAKAIAWLAHRFMQRQAGNLPAVTGARGARLLGALYPAE